MSNSACLRIAAALVGLILAGCGGRDDDSPAPSADADTPPATDEQSATEETNGPETTKIWLTTGEQLKPVERELDGKGDEVEAAAEALVEGPTEKEEGGNLDAATEIPSGVDVESVDVAGDGTATVEVSKDFLAGVPADPDARDAAQNETLDARLSQVTYTLTQFDDVEATKVVAGGISAGPPQDRSDFAKPQGGPPPTTKAKGSYSSGTAAVQQKLANFGYLPPGAVDGLNGYRTQQAVIAFQSWEGLARDGIVGPQTQAALANAKRPKPQKSGPAKRIEVYRSKGVTLLIRDGKTRRAVHTSSGAPSTPTPSGSFSVFRKEKNSWSVPFQQWLPYASYFNAGIAFHEYAQVPTYPASHGCVRVPSPEAKYVYRFATIGTAVIVI
ncbi:MAG: N-acetylmuramoyl-L-alanine amidase [Solirubrobacterales bacterium]|jgi:lipoprotein-anchoring transpeptidase ErfK/SrfK|nr:N-acetylmuramoyl-L-alanine amidase [Solirubrobacterales bacterium]